MKEIAPRFCTSLLCMAFVAVPLRPLELHLGSSTSVSTHQPVKRVRPCLSTCAMNAAGGSERPSRTKPQLGMKGRKNNTQEQDEDERLQNDRPFVLREFGKVALAAVGIGIILFCFDILVSLLALTVGGLYALAVLFDIRVATDMVARLRASVVTLWSNMIKRARRVWSSVRRQILNLTED